MPHSERIWTDSETLNEQNIELEGEVRETDASAAVESAR